MDITITVKRDDLLQAFKENGIEPTEENLERMGDGLAGMTAANLSQDVGDLFDQFEEEDEFSKL
jgi:hypothetical protein